MSADQELVLRIKRAKVAVSLAAAICKMADVDLMVELGELAQTPEAVLHGVDMQTLNGGARWAEIGKKAQVLRDSCEISEGTLALVRGLVEPLLSAEI